MSDPTEAAAPRPLSDSDPSAGESDGLAGGMGVSSERTGPVRGTPGQVTHGTEDTSADAPTDELPAYDPDASGNSAS